MKVPVGTALPPRGSVLLAFSRTRSHVALLALFLPAYVVLMLADRHQESDEPTYLKIADHLSHGYYTMGGRDVSLWFGPGLSLLATPFVALGAPLEVTRLLGPILLTGAVLLFYATLRQRLSPRASLAGAATLGVYWPLFTMLPSLHSELPAVLSVTAFMCAYTLDSSARRWWTFFACGAALAFLCLSRPVFGWVLVVVLAFWLPAAALRRTRPLRQVAMIVTAFVLCTPWLVTTHRHSGKVFYWSSAGGLSLYWMAAPYEGHLGDWHSVENVFESPQLAADRPFFRSVSSLTEVERDDALRTRAVELIRSHPLHYVRNIGANLSRLWFDMPFSFTRQTLSTTFYIVPNALLLLAVLAAAGLLTLRRRVFPPEWKAFAVLALAGIAVQALLAAYTRMLYPVVPLLLWLAIHAGSSWLAERRLARFPPAARGR